MDPAPGGGDGMRELVEFGAFVEEADGALVQVALAVGRRGVVAEDDERDIRVGGTHRLQDLEAAAAFELDVQHPTKHPPEPDRERHSAAISLHDWDAKRGRRIAKMLVAVLNAAEPEIEQ